MVTGFGGDHQTTILDQARRFSEPDHQFRILLHQEA